MALGWLWWRAWWQAWRLATSTFFCVAGVALMALGWLWWRAWGPLVARDAAALCVAGVALGDIHCHFAWQAWHLATPTFVLRGRRGACGTGLPLVACLGPVGRPSHRGTLRGSCGTHPPSLCVAGVALGDIDALFVCGRRFRFVWQAWHLWRVGLCGTQAKVASRCPNRVVRLSMGKVRKGDVL